jgi:hypothetical protein
MVIGELFEKGNQVGVALANSRFDIGSSRHRPGR